ncbi:cytochrome P450 [Bordetella sp. 2513F-2]
MPAMPRDQRLDSTAAFLADPYRYISRRCAQLGSDCFEARILFAPAICMTGPQAGEVFYDTARMQRAGAAPRLLRSTLFGHGGVQGLDGAHHVHRKALFLEVLAPERVRVLGDCVRSEWAREAQTWPADGEVVLYDAARAVLTRAVCAWAGVPLAGHEVGQRMRQLTALYDDAAAGLAGNLAARAARMALEQWLAGLVEAVRRGRLRARHALAEVSSHRDFRGRPLPARVAAVELLNLLRPTVATSVFVVFAALAAHRHPAEVPPLDGSDPARLQAFLDEVRRFYPFFPAVAARVRETFAWQGAVFPRGRRVLFDLYGTNHDPRAWADPEVFDPRRFLEREPDVYSFVPQGGNGVALGHRCPGEGVATTVMAETLAFLFGRLQYRVLPGQDLSLDFGRLPALPRSSMRIAVGGPSVGAPAR